MIIACLAMLSKSDLVTLVFMMVCVDTEAVHRPLKGREGGKEGGGGGGEGLFRALLRHALKIAFIQQEASLDFCPPFFGQFSCFFL